MNRLSITRKEQLAFILPWVFAVVCAGVNLTLPLAFRIVEPRFERVTASTTALETFHKFQTLSDYNTKCYVTTQSYTESTQRIYTQDIRRVVADMLEAEGYAPESLHVWVDEHAIGVTFFDRKGTDLGTAFYHYDLYDGVARPFVRYGYEYYDNTQPVTEYLDYDITRALQEALRAAMILNLPEPPTPTATIEILAVGYTPEFVTLSYKLTATC